LQCSRVWRLHTARCLGSMPGLHAACLDCLMWREKGRKRTEAHCIDFLSKLLHSIIPDPKIDPCAGLCSMRDKSLLMWHSSYRVCLTSLSCDCRDPLERLVRDLSIYKDNSDFERQVLAIYEKVVKGALAEKEVSFVKSLDSTLSTASSSRPPASPDIDGSLTRCVGSNSKKKCNWQTLRAMLVQRSARSVKIGELRILSNRNPWSQCP
jgi:hypothetical protein